MKANRTGKNLRIYEWPNPAAEIVDTVRDQAVTVVCVEDAIVLRDSMNDFISEICEGYNSETPLPNPYQKLRVYDPKSKTLTLGNGTVYSFYCGEELNDKALTLVEFMTNNITLQEAYNELAEHWNQEVTESILDHISVKLEELEERLREEDEDH